MPLLIGFGFRAFSVEPVLIPRLAATVRTAHSAQYAPLLRFAPNEVFREFLNRS
jgi:phosphoenolpyruvate-protein kinase (PTS system EI component)